MTDIERIAEIIPLDDPATLTGRQQTIFWSKVDKSQPSGCWEWKAYKSKGYGRFGFYYKGKPKNTGAHRVSYYLAHGTWHKTLDHLCRNPACCNPSHLEPVTIRENTLRGVGPTSQNAQRSHCRSGHPLFGDNLIIVTATGRPDARGCRTCRNAASRRRHSYLGGLLREGRALTDIEALAASLRKPQYRACINLEDDLWKAAPLDGWRRSGQACTSLCDMRIAERTPVPAPLRWHYRLTPLGQQVRAHLIAQEKGDE